MAQYDDQSGVGNATVTLPRPSRYVNVYYSGPGVLELRANDELRIAPAGSSVCEFGAPASELTLSGSGLWIIHKSSSRVTSALASAAGAVSSLNTTLQNNSAVTGNGATADLTGQAQTTLSVEGTATAFSVVIEGSVNGTNFYPLEVIQRGTLEILDSITEKGIYMVDLSGLSKLRARIASISGGSLTVIAR